MAYTRAQLYREVADFLKESGAVTPGSTSPTARKIADNELAAAEQVLSLHPWNFALDTKRLQRVATADPDDPDSDPIGWKYAYAKGAVLHTHWISPTGRHEDRITRPGQWTDQGGRILANLEVVYLNGVQAIFATEEKMGYWPRPVGTAIASVIADRLTGAVTNSRGLSSDMTMRSSGLIETAKTWDAQQAPPPPRRAGRWNRGRRFHRFGTGEL